jgi:hypothetical protein
MRFSLRVLLLAMAYVAIAAAAIRVGSVFLADAVWFVTLGALCYAGVVAFTGNGRRRAMAAGFVILAAAYVASIFLIPHHVPAARLLRVSGWGVTTAGEVYVLGAAPMARAWATSTLRAANGIGTMVVGLIGAGIGALAHRNSKREQYSDVD